MTMGKFVKTQAEGHILTVTLDRPGVLNALHAPACHELAAIWDDFAANDDLWVAIINGTGKAFCAGHDLVDGFFDAMPESGWAGLARRESLNKPLICAVQGYAFGGGWEIAMACDIVIADTSAAFALPEPRVGFAALGGGANRLVRRMPWHVAMGLLLTGNRIDAETAHRWGGGHGSGARGNRSGRRAALCRGHIEIRATGGAGDQGGGARHGGARRRRKGSVRALTAAGRSFDDFARHARGPGCLCAKTPAGLDRTMKTITER
jgi:hypothetical protein